MRKIIVPTIFLVILILGSSQLLVAASAQQNDFTITLNPGATNSDSQNPVSPSANITVATGTNVTWINKDLSPHMLVSGTPEEGPDNIFYGDFFGPEENYTVTFEEPGTYPYYDAAWGHIRGVITVESSEFSSDLESSLDNSGTGNVEDSGLGVDTETTDVIGPNTDINNFNGSENGITSFPSTSSSSSLSTFPSFTADNFSNQSSLLSSLASDQTLGSIIKKVGPPLLGLLMSGSGGASSSSSLSPPSSFPPITSSPPSFTQSNGTFGVAEAENQSSFPSLTNKSSSPDQTLGSIIMKVGPPLLGLLMNLFNSSNNLDENQGSSAYFSNDMNNIFDNSSSLPATNDFATSEFINKSSYHVSEFWLKEGTGEGEAISAEGIVVDQNNNTYVSDFYEDEILKRDNLHDITTWGSNGSGDGQFIGPGKMALDSSNNVYVVDRDNDRIQKFDSNGAFITKWGSNGTGDGQFESPRGIAIDSLDNVYVVDGNTDRIQKFDSNGSFITSWHNSIVSDLPGSLDITTDSSNNVYVTGFFSDGIYKFDSNGALIENNTFFSQILSPAPLSIEAGPHSIFVVGTSAVDDSITEFDNNLNYISTFDVNDLKPGLRINDIYVDSNNNIFATLSGEGYGKEVIGVDMKVVKLVPQP